MAGTGMRQVIIDGFGGPEVLKVVDGEVPTPGEGELLVKVEAAGVNRPDVLQRLGGYNPPPGASEVPGLELAGTVTGTGAGTSRFEEGDRVCALVSGGGYAGYCVVPEPQALPFPKGYSAVEAAAVPETYFTVWTNVFERGRLKPGETLLVHGGSSGIGTTAIQLAKLRGSTVYCTVGNAEKAQACEALGADKAINYKEKDFVEAVKELTEGRGVDVILDMVGGSYVERNIKSLAVEGRLVQIAWLDTPKVSANFAALMLKRLTWTGSTLRARSIEEKGRIAAELEREVWPALGDGTVKPQIFKTFSIEDVALAHRLMESSEHIGKIVLTLDR